MSEIYRFRAVIEDAGKPAGDAWARAWLRAQGAFRDQSWEATVEALDPLSPPEWSQVNTILDQFHNLQRQFCTACGYCMPCPHGVDIPENFRIYNHDQVYGLRDWARQQYARLDPAKQASACTECGECEPKCPNQIPIRKQLQMVRDRFASPPSEVA